MLLILLTLLTLLTLRTLLMHLIPRVQSYYSYGSYCSHYSSPPLRQVLTDSTHAVVAAVRQRVANLTGYPEVLARMLSTFRRARGTCGAFRT